MRCAGRLPQPPAGTRITPVAARKRSAASYRSPWRPLSRRAFRDGRRPGDKKRPRPAAATPRRRKNAILYLACRRIDLETLAGNVISAAAAAAAAGLPCYCRVARVLSTACTCCRAPLLNHCCCCAVSTRLPQCQSSHAARSRRRK